MSGEHGPENEGVVSEEAANGPVAVTGVGAVSPFGWTSEDLWQGLLTGRSSVRVPERLDTEGHRTREAGEVPAPEPGIAERHPAWGEWSWADRFAVMAAEEALNQAFGEARAPVRCGVFFGGSTAGMYEGERYYRQLLDGTSSRLRDLRSHQLNGPGDAVARQFGCTGLTLSVSSACASGALALGDALDALRSGEVDVALAGGSDALCQLTYAGFNALRAIDGQHSRPFRAERAGLNLGEGAGVLVLETVAGARRRGAEVLALLSGAGASCDAHHMTAPHPEGEGAARAIRAALEDASVTPDSIGFLNAHGTGTPLNDSSESLAAESVFGARALPLTSAKGAIGHFLGAAGAVEAVLSVLVVQQAQVPPTHGAGTVDESCPVDLVQKDPRQLDPSRTSSVSTNFAFGGANAAVVIGPSVR
ncbi:MAG: beta-ketoacyl-[acyl-carrier-protein] synthase family protein [Acidobacteriota bacterium]